MRIDRIVPPSALFSSHPPPTNAIHTHAHIILLLFVRQAIEANAGEASLSLVLMGNDERTMALENVAGSVFVHVYAHTRVFRQCDKHHWSVCARPLNGFRECHFVTAFSRGSHSNARAHTNYNSIVFFFWGVRRRRLVWPPSKDTQRERSRKDNEIKSRHFRVRVVRARSLLSSSRLCRLVLRWRRLCRRVDTLDLIC